MTNIAPQASIRSIGIDPAPYRHLASGQRTAEPHFMGWTYDPRPEFTHVPVHTNVLLAAFRDDWDAVMSEGNLDLGEFAEEVGGRLCAMVDEAYDEHSADVSDEYEAAHVEALFAVRVIGRIARVFPRPLADAQAIADANKARLLAHI